MKKNQDKATGGKKVMVFGTFDGIHDGHRNMFRQAKKHGEHLIVVVARDATVLEVKGDGPVRDEIDRLSDMLTEDVAQDIVMGRNGDKYEVLREFQPDVVALGYDQTHFVDGIQKKLKEFKLQKTKIVRLKPYKDQKYKSSIINNRVRDLKSVTKTMVKQSEIETDVEEKKARPKKPKKDTSKKTESPEKQSAKKRTRRGSGKSRRVSSSKKK